MGPKYSKKGPVMVWKLFIKSFFSKRIDRIIRIQEIRDSGGSV
jgi:hypothetical protein